MVKKSLQQYLKYRYWKYYMYIWGGILQFHRTLKIVVKNKGLTHEIKCQESFNRNDIEWFIQSNDKERSMLESLKFERSADFRTCLFRPKLWDTRFAPLINFVRPLYVSTHKVADLPQYCSQGWFNHLLYGIRRGKK